MRTNLLRSLIVASAVATPLVAQQPTQTATPTPIVPAVGEMAPDFTLPAAGKDGITSEPVTLSKLRGKVVVLAFYPADRTSGCTAEMTKFRDDFTKLFGDGVVVLPISKDSLGSHASWAKDMNMPFVLVSDTAGSVARTYGSQSAPGRYFSRNVFVVGKDGKIAHTIVRLNALSEDAYTALGAAVAAAKK
ncbi:MAG TPA: peroxiredoxin [Gemmatimonadaceae bacterium]|nr:peroxiredoxin [Gemmatimonadaceae bacterium]